jgi:hypothetical protein
MRRAISVTVASLIMAALILGVALVVVRLGDSSDAAASSRVRLLELEEVSLAYQLSLRASALAYLDSLASSLSVLSPSAITADALASEAAASLSGMAFSASDNVSLSEVHPRVDRGTDGSLLLRLGMNYTVADSFGDTLDVNYSVEISHPLKLLSLSSLVSDSHAVALGSLVRMGGTSLRSLSALNSTSIDPLSGVSVTTVVLASSPGSLVVATSASDSGHCVVLGGGYSYVVEESSVVAFAWSQ